METRNNYGYMYPMIKHIPDKSNVIAMEFFLPKGSFATTVLREIMKKD